MRNSPPGNSTLEFQQRSGTSGALLGSLLLLGASFLLLVLGPGLLARFSGSATAMPAGSYLNIAAASGIALGGGAAMIAVVSRLVRDIELRPYAGLAPVLAVFAGFVLWSLRAELPLSGVGTEYAGVFALALSVAGGALIGQPGALAHAVGWLLTLFAPGALLLMLWSASGQAQLGNALASFPQPLKMYMELLGGSALVLGIMGEVGRALRMRQHTHTRALEELDEEPARYGSSEPIPLRLPRRERTALREEEAERIFPTPEYGTASLRGAEGSAGLRSQKPLPSADAYLLQSHQLTPHVPVAQSYEPQSVWEFEQEQPLIIPKKNLWLRALLLLVVVVGGGGAALYYGVWLPNHEKEQAALQRMEQQKAVIQAREEREAQEKREAEAKAQAARLEKQIDALSAQAREGEQALPSTGGAAAIAPRNDSPAPAAKAAP